MNPREKPLRVLVADDEAMARKRLVRLLGDMPDVEVAGQCWNAREVLAALRTEEVDLLLLDIQMPELSGLEALALLPPGAPPVVFCTAHAGHAVAAFEVGAIDYLLKPIEAGRLRKALDRAHARRAARETTPTGGASTTGESSEGGGDSEGGDEDEARGARPGELSLDRLALPTRQGVVLLDPASISHALLADELVTVYAGGKELLGAMSLQELEERLPSSTFVRVHRRALVNLAHVVRLVPNEVGGYLAETSSGHNVEVSRQAARELRRRLGLR